MTKNFYVLYNGSVYIQIMVIRQKSREDFLQWLKTAGYLYVELPIRCLIKVMGRRALSAGGGVLRDHWPGAWPGEGLRYGSNYGNYNY